jgi:hypothetical protein
MRDRERDVGMDGKRILIYLNQGIGFGWFGSFKWISNFNSHHLS